MAQTVLKLEGEDRIRLDLYFHTITSEQITLSTDITDHIVEDHTSIQDHITIKPITFTMRGLISEKVYQMPNQSKWNQWIENISNKLTPLKVLAPTINSYFQSAINLYEAIEDKVEQIAFWGKSAIGTKNTSGTLAINKAWMQSVFRKTDHNYGRWSKDYVQNYIVSVLDSYRVNRIPVDIDTGWGNKYRQENGDYFYITDVSLSQDATYQQSELSVTVKQLRFAITETAQMTVEEAKRLYQQNQDMQNTVTGQTESWLYQKTIKGYGGYE